MYQPKVKETQKYSDSQGEYIVCKGKLVPVKSEKGDSTVFYFDGALETHYNPTIISETEEIGEGDWVYIENWSGDKLLSTHVGRLDKKWKNESDCVVDGKIYYLATEGHSSKVYKILALPEHFSNKHLQAIVDGKMEEGEVLVNCVIERDGGENIYKINIDQQNHITLFPAQQSLGTASYKYSINFLDSDKKLTGNELEQAFKAGANWAKKNNY